MITYQTLITNLKSQPNTKIYIKNIYTVIIFLNEPNYHVTIYKDQWDLYEKTIELPYYLFHISANETEPKCSTYFWVDKLDHHIKIIPEKYFKYEQPIFSFEMSTRKPCDFDKIKHVVEQFQRLLENNV